MEEKIKVFVQYPWMFPDSPYYEYLLTNPYVEYVNPLVSSREIKTNPASFVKNSSFKSKIRKIVFSSKIPLPNARYTFMTKEANIIHAAHCLSLNNYPWVCDMEIWFQAIVSDVTNKKGIWLAKKILQKNNCKKIICWTEETRDRMLRLFNYDKKIWDKSIIIYPGIKGPNSIIKKKSSKEFKIVFFGRNYHAKGGNYVVNLVNKLNKNYPFVKGIIISDVPEDVLKDNKNKNIEFKKLMSRDEMYDFLQECDLFVYPGISDTFGYGFLDAMSVGLPIITCDGYARNEIVKDGYNGFVCKSEKDKINGYPYLIDENDLYDKTRKLVLDRKLLKSFSENSLERFYKKFSLDKFHRKMSEIYEDCFNSSL